jgi:hypothetical protein
VFRKLTWTSAEAGLFLEKSRFETIQPDLSPCTLADEALMKLVVPVIVTIWLFVPQAEPSAAKQDGQSSFEPSSQPGSGQKYLVKMVGDWEVSKVFYPRGGEPVRSSGECKQTMIQDGRFLQCEFVFQQGGKKSTGQGIIGFEPDSGRFTSFWIDSRQTRMSARQSRDPFDGTKIVLYSVALDAQAKDSRRSKTISYLADDGRKLIHRQYALGGDAEERLVMELIMTRKP